MVYTQGLTRSGGRVDLMAKVWEIGELSVEASPLRPALFMYDGPIKVNIFGSEIRFERIDLGNKTEFISPYLAPIKAGGE